MNREASDESKPFEHKYEAREKLKKLLDNPYLNAAN